MHGRSSDKIIADQQSMIALDMANNSPKGR